MEIFSQARQYRGDTLISHHLSLDEEVTRGAEMLDKLAPGWHKKVKQSTLDLSSLSVCVLGQLASTKMFADALATDELGGEWDGYNEAIPALIRHWEKVNGTIFPVAFDREGAANDYGFCYDYIKLQATAKVFDLGSDPEDVLEPWDVLTKTWIYEIKARRKADREAKS